MSTNTTPDDEDVEQPETTLALDTDDSDDGLTLCVCGSRTFMAGDRYDPAHAVLVVGATLNDRFDRELTSQITRVVSGGARGPDQLGEAWASANDMPVGPDDRFTPDWDEYGKQAGIRRNKHLLAESDIVVALWDGQSNGTEFMIERARSDPDIALTVVRVDSPGRPWDDLELGVEEGEH